MRVLLVDATNSFIRNYVVLPTLNRNGEPFGGVYGFLTNIRKFIELTKPDKVILAWDGAGGSKKRRALDENYKKGRKPPRLNRNFDFENIDPDKNRIYQRNRLALYLEDLPVHEIIIEDIEADDAIGYLWSFYKGHQKIIASSDKDFHQLLDDETIIYKPKKKIIVTKTDHYKEFGIHSHNFLLARSLIGDTGDNIKGVRGIGPKTLLKLFPFFANKEPINLEQVLNHAKENLDGSKKYQTVLDSEEVIIINQKIMELRTPIIGSSSIRSIKETLEVELSFNPTSFRLKLLDDGIKTVGYSFYQVFKGLTLK